MKLHYLLKVLFEIVRVHLRFLLLFGQLRGKFISIKSLSKHKHHSKLIIIGSGDTTNTFLKSQEHSRKLLPDVMTLSYSGLLNIDIRYQFYEKPRTTKLVIEHITKILPEFKNKIQQDEYGIFINKDPKNNKKFPGYEFIDENNLIVINSKLRHSEDIKVFLKIFQKCKISDYCTVQIRGSLFTLVYLAKKLDYREVLLVGFDLNGSPYFFMHNDIYKALNLTDPYLLDDWIPELGYHFTSDPSNKQPIQDVMNFITYDDNFKLFIYGKESLLSAIFPSLADEELVEFGYIKND